MVLKRIIPAVVNTSGSIGDCCAREDVAFHDAIRSEGSGSTCAPVDVVGSGASLQDDLPTSWHSQCGGCAENKDGVGLEAGVQDEIA